jgi:hypothetical protein
MPNIYPAPKPALQAAIAILASAFAVPSSFYPTPIAVGFRLPPGWPATKPAEFVRVSRVGGRMLNLITDSPRVLVECWGPDVGTVEQMTCTARGALLNSLGQRWAGIYVREWVNEQGPVDFDDPQVTDMRRWQFHGDLLVSTT